MYKKIGRLGFRNTKKRIILLNNKGLLSRLAECPSFERNSVGDHISDIIKQKTNNDRKSLIRVQLSYIG